MILFRILLVLLCLALGQGAFAQLPVPGRNAMSVSLVAQSREVAPGETVILALRMSPDPGWHGYWKNPGDAGRETLIDWDLPDGVAAGPIQYPVPDRLMISGLMNYVYEGEYTHLIEVRIAEDLAVGTRLPIRGAVDYLVCTDEVCVPERATVATELVVGDAAGRSTAFDGVRAALPRPLDSQGRFEIADGRLRLAIPVPASLDLDEPYFFPLTHDALDYAAEQTVSRSGDWLIVETAADEDAARLEPIEGVLKIGEDRGLSLTAVPGPVPATAAAVSVPIALLGAFLGGLLLNVMPCVFPILSLKALSLAKAGADERGARRDSLAYAAGAILACLALGLALLVLRASGEMVGWAFQLQDPRVILFLLLLVTAIALNLAGLFELPSFGGGRLGRAGSFWTGALAAFVATPCTGPFMGAALGAALILPPAAALAVFAGLGLGLAFPFLLLGFVPALRRRLPRPGAWMARLRHILSVPMFLTALGLAWILGRQAGADGMALGLGAALILALGLWWTGKRQGGPRAWLPLLPAAALALAAIMIVPTATPAVARTPDALNAEPFSEARLAALRAEGRPVFVYFTADWCVTCKVNEAGALNRDEVAQSFAARNIAVLAGDWTLGDPAIGRFLEKHGRSGIPLYLYYAPGEPVQVLPQILTAGRLTELG